MIQQYYRRRSMPSHRIVRSLLMFVAALGIACSAARGQAVSYTCFPSCNEEDARFLSIAGTGIHTLAGQTVTMTLTSPSSDPTLEIGFFDGETGGKWDVGSTPVIYTLYADPDVDGAGGTKIGEWRGDSMPDNKWYTVMVSNAQEAKSASGTYFYVMQIRSLDTSLASWSNFKIRTDGTINLRQGQAFNVTAPLPNLATAQIVFPNYPTLDSSTYDGSWTFYLYVPAPTSVLTVWDGDMDFGAFDCSTLDDDDPDTQNEVLPPWAPGTSAVHEGVAKSSLACTNGDTATSNPTDDSQSPALRRSPSVIYELIDPNGISYANANPSGNLEWEDFRISTAPFDRSLMDYHADSLPAGVYKISMSGMDMQNLNAWRFGNVALGINSPYIVGVDAEGAPVLPPPAVTPDTASIAGTIFFDPNSNGARDAGEETIEGLRVVLAADFDDNGTIDLRDTTVTDANGAYRFANLKSGRYSVSVDTTPLGSDAAATYDLDGIATPGTASVTIDATHQTIVAGFGYRRTISATMAGADTVMGSASATFSVGSAPEGATYQWSVSGAAEITGSATGSSVTINSGNFGEFTLSVTITKDGSSTTLSKTVTVAGIDFALFAYDYLYFRGSSGDTARGVINGNVGVNNPANTRCASYPVLTLGGGCTSNPVIVGDGYRVMGDYIDLGGSKVSVYDLYANRQTSGSSNAKKRNSGPASFTAPIIRSSNLPRIPSFSYGSRNITVQSNATLTLEPGKYGVITIRDGGALTLTAGIYNIKSIRAGRNVRINTDAASKVRIGRDLIIGDNGYVGPHNGTLFIVRSDGICYNYPTVDFGAGTEFHGQVFAPNGKIDLGRGTDLTGRFWGKIIVSDYDVNVTYYSPVTLLSRSNNNGFQKKLLGGTTGAAGISSLRNYPNPFTSSTMIGFSLDADAAVTMRVVDATGDVVRTIAENRSMTKGMNEIAWDGLDDNGRELPSGAYFCTVESARGMDVMKVVKE